MLRLLPTVILNRGRGGGLADSLIRAIDAWAIRMYDILFSEGVIEDLAGLRANERARVLDRIEVQLRYEPERQSRNRKILGGLIPPWETVAPVWQLRVGQYRVFYDVNESESAVIVRAVRRKPPHRTTEEIL